MAEWLDTTFRGFDGALFEGMNALLKAAGSFFTPFFEFITFFGDGGWFFIAMAVVFLFFRRTRKAGLSMGFALLLGLVFVNLLLKPLVARPRPYLNEDFRLFWEMAGSHLESSKSFPSGHSSASFGAMTAFFLVFSKKWSWTGLVFAALIAISRVYLIVHYATDVIVGVLIGILDGILGYYITKGLYALFLKKGWKWLEDFDACEWLKGKIRKEPSKENNQD